MQGNIRRNERVAWDRLARADGGDVPSFSLQAQIALWEMIESGAVEILPLGNEDVARMKELMRKYRDLPMDLADAALVRVAERERLRRIFTVDRSDFHVYRPARIGRFTVLPSRL